jgi:hypothetical protein
MLKWQKISAAELIETMREAHAALYQLILLPDCAPVVAELKAGCEQCADTLVSMDAAFSSAAAFYKTAVSNTKIPDDALSLDAFADDFAVILERIRVSLEFVFFSYKISMFDSFETVVRACNADPDIEAFVVPIPYFDKNRDDTIGKMHFEDMRNLPQYFDMNIVDFRNYDLKKRRPDAIFINNPYDEQNAVTTIHPDFYCENIAGYTNLLVYIPYFVTNESDNEKTMIGEHFVETMGCIFADRVFVQSENARASYVYQYLKIAEYLANAEALKAHSDKFVATGSPKFEKVINENEQSYEIPDDWKAKIYRPDGSKKTVIFFNTGVSSVLYYTYDKVRKLVIPTYLNKLKSILSEFEKRDDCVLLWRPHPLIENTVKSLRPSLYAEYKSITEDFFKKDFGIYDTSDDFHMAAAVSDAFFGDTSSVQYLFTVTGKPSLCPNYNLSDKKYYIDSFVKIDDDLYFTVRGYNILWKAGSGNKATPLSELPCISDYSVFGFSGMAECMGKIYITPENASDIIIYDIKENKATVFDYDKTLMNKDRTASTAMLKFKGVFTENEYVYFIGNSYPAIIKFSPGTGEKVYFTDYVKKLSVGKLSAAFNGTGILVNDFDYKDGFIYLASERLKGFVRVNTETGKTTLYKLDETPKGITAIAVSGDTAYLSDYTEKTPVLIYDLKAKKIIREVPIPDDFDRSEEFSNTVSSRFTKFLINNNKLYIFPQYCLKAYEVDLTDNSFKTLLSFEPQIYKSSFSVSVSGDNVLFTGYGNAPFISKISGGEILQTDFNIDFSGYKKANGISLNSVYSFFLSERPELMLNDFLDDLSDGKYKDKTYFDEKTKKYALYNSDASKRIIKNCKDFLKKGKTENGN